MRNLLEVNIYRSLNLIIEKLLYEPIGCTCVCLYLWIYVHDVCVCVCVHACGERGGMDTQKLEAIVT